MGRPSLTQARDAVLDCAREAGVVEPAFRTAARRMFVSQDDSVMRQGLFLYAVFAEDRAMVGDFLYAVRGDTRARASRVLFELGERKWRTLVNGMTAVSDSVERLEDAVRNADPEAAIVELSVLRQEVDSLERLVADEKWPLPKYREMLFVY